MDEISKKDLLAETGISYGQLYRWKREGLIPEEWFVKRAAFTGQETWFPRERVLERVGLILQMKDGQSLEEIRRQIEGAGDGELEGLAREAASTAERIGISASAVLFETNDGRHFALLAKGNIFFDGGVRILKTLTEKQLRERIKTVDKEESESAVGQAESSRGGGKEEKRQGGGKEASENATGKAGALQDNGKEAVQSQKKGVE